MNELIKIKEKNGKQARKYFIAMIKKRQKIEKILKEYKAYETGGLTHAINEIMNLIDDSNYLLTLDGKTIPVTFRISKYEPKINMDLDKY